MSVGAPVSYKRIEVGRVETKTLTPDGEAVVFEIFVEAPHHLRLTQGSRFWNTSGIKVELGAEGAKLQVDSFSSFLRGGITFDTVALGGGPVEDNYIFRLFPSESGARSSIFDDDYGAQIRLSIEFSGSVRGLSVGAPVELRGYKVGEVIDVIAAVDDSAGVPSVSLITTVLLQPSRLGLPRGEADESLDFLKRLVRNGLRAKLASASLITSSLYIQLVDEPGGPEQSIDEEAYPYPRLPSVASDGDDLAASAESVLDRINGLPIEELLASATTLLDNVNQIVASEDTRAIPGGVNALLADAQGLVGDPALAQATGDLAATIAAAREVVESVQREEIAASLKTALAAATTTAGAITLAAADAPAMMANLASLSETANGLPLDELVASATALVRSADTVIGAESTAALPADISAALADMRALLGDLREADAATNLATALAEAGEAAKSIRIAADGTPAMMANLASLSETANGLPLDELVASATSFVQNADAFVASEGIARLPDDVSAALGDIRVLLGDLREADAAQNLAIALERAGSAATSISAAVEGTPELIARMTGVAENVEALPLDRLIAETETLMRDTRALVGSDAVRRVPSSISTTLANIDTLLVELRQAEITARLAGALDAATTTAGSITTAAAGMPGVLSQIEGLAGQVRALPLDQLIARTDMLLANIDRIVSAPGAEQLPEAVTAAFDQIRVTVADLQRRDVPKNFNETLVSFNGASLAFQGLSANLNAVLPQVAGLAARADSVLSEFDVGSELNYEAITTIREIRDAARAITALVATIERQPNSLILGK
jgi:paraquat-inducible protein B